MAEERMQFDKFERRWDKRFALYEATRDLLAIGFDETKSTEEIKSAIKTYGLRVLESKFLLDEEMYAYLRDVRREVETWRSEKLKAGQATDPDEKRAHEKLWRNSFTWITTQGTEEFPEKFMKFLVPPDPVRPWWYNYDTMRSGVLRMIKRRS